MKYVLASLLLSIISSCSFAPARVKTSGVLSRSVILDNTGSAPDNHFLAIGGGFQKTSGFEDGGRTGEAYLGGLFLEYKPFEYITIGTKLDFGFAQWDIDDNFSVSYEPYIRVLLFNENKWSSQFYFSYGYVSNKKDGKSGSSCKKGADDTWTCSNDNLTVTSSAKIWIQEPGLSWIFERAYHDKLSIAVVPFMKRTIVKSLNTIVGQPDIQKRTSFWTPGAWIYHVFRTQEGKKARFMLQTGIGVVSDTSFDTTNAHTYHLLADINASVGFY